MDFCPSRIEDEYRIPGVVGIIDGTHVEICSQAIPIATEHQYVNRKQKHSLNVQIVSSTVKKHKSFLLKSLIICSLFCKIVDDKYRIRALNAKHRGRTHDSAIWNMSLVRDHIQGVLANKHQWLIGDSGYPLEPWLLVPFDHENGVGERRYNRHFKQARSIVERAIGEFKPTEIFLFV